MTDSPDLNETFRKVVKFFTSTGICTAALDTPTEGQCFPYAGGDLTFTVTGTFSMPFGWTPDIRVYRTDPATGDDVNTHATLGSTADGLTVTVPAGQLTEVTGNHCASLRISIRGFNPLASIPYTTAGSRAIQVCRNCGSGTGSGSGSGTGTSSGTSSGTGGGTIGTGSGTATGTASGTGSSTIHGPTVESKATGEGYGAGPSKKPKRPK